ANGWEAADESWIEPVQRAVYPEAARRRAPEPAPGCPAFGQDSVLERPDHDAPGRDNVQPGLHALGARDGGGYSVVWWGPRALTLDVQPVVGIGARISSRILAATPSRRTGRAIRSGSAIARPRSRGAARQASSSAPSPSGRSVAVPTTAR